MNQERPYPRAIVSRKAAKALVGGHPWVFEDEVIRTEPASDGMSVSNGGVVDVFEENGTWQGTGLLSAQSKIRIRIVTRNSNDRVDEGFWRRKLAWAWTHRETTMGRRAPAASLTPTAAVCSSRRQTAFRDSWWTATRTFSCLR